MWYRGTVFCLGGSLAVVAVSPLYRQSSTFVVASSCSLLPRGWLRVGGVMVSPKAVAGFFVPTYPSYPYNSYLLQLLRYFSLVGYFYFVHVSIALSTISCVSLYKIYIIVYVSSYYVSHRHLHTKWQFHQWRVIRISRVRNILVRHRRLCFTNFPYH